GGRKGRFDAPPTQACPGRWTRARDRDRCGSQARIRYHEGMGIATQPPGPAAAAAEQVVELTPAPQPWDVFLRLAGLPFPLFLDSALRHPTLGRYSFVAADPFERLVARGARTSVSGESRPREPADPFAVLRQRLAPYRGETIPGLPPFQGGAAG